MNKIRHTIIPAVYLILEKDGLVLYQKRKNTGWKDGYYSLPSGHVEPGEGAATAAVREAMEEIGVSIGINDLELAHFIHRPAEEDNTIERADIFFVIKKWSGEPTNVEPHKCEKITWCSPKSTSNLDGPVIDLVDHVLRSYKSSKFSNYGWGK